MAWATGSGSASYSSDWRWCSHRITASPVVRKAEPNTDAALQRRDGGALTTTGLLPSTLAAPRALALWSFWALAEANGSPAEIGPVAVGFEAWSTDGGPRPVPGGTQSSERTLTPPSAPREGPWESVCSLS